MSDKKAPKKWQKAKDAVSLPKLNKNVIRAPKTLPPPGHLHDASHVKLDDDKIDFKSLLPSASMRERGRRTPFSPSAPVAMNITDLVYNEIVAA